MKDYAKLLKSPALVVAAILMLLVVPAALGQVDDGYELPWFVMGGGGGTASNGSYRIASTIGQPVIGQSSGSHSLRSGFWSGILPRLDLAITKTDGRTVVQPGDILEYTLTISNESLQNATGVVVNDTLPAHTTFLDASDGGTLSDDVVSWPSFTLAASASESRTVRVEVNDLPAGVERITNSATVTDDGASGADLDLSNNSSSDVNSVEASPDLTLTNDNQTLIAEAGDTLTYSLTVRNNGSRAATGVTLSDTLSEETIFVAASDGGSESDGVVTWPSFDLQVGQEVTRTLSVWRVNQLADGIEVITNTATVTLTNGPDANPADNTALDVDRVAGEISGMVMGDGSPLSGITVTAYRLNGNQWDAVLSTSTVAGAYTLVGLRSGTYRVGFADPTGGYAFEYYDDGSEINQASDVNVTIGATTADINATLLAASHITGVVSAVDSGAALSNIRVTAYRFSAGSWHTVAQTDTDGDGHYDLGGLPVGSYYLGFQDPAGDYAFEYFDDVPLLSESGFNRATSVEITSAGQTVSAIDASLAAAANITGQITDANDGAGISNISVIIHACPPGAFCNVQVGETTSAGGSYTVEGLRQNDPIFYFMRLQDEEQAVRYATEYYHNAFQAFAATSIFASSPSTNIDEDLESSGTIMGSVTDTEGHPLAGITVYLYEEDGSLSASTVSDASGNYQIQGLRDSTNYDSTNYVVEFVDLANTYGSEYYDDQSQFSAADPVLATQSGSEANASLDRGTNGAIAGTVMGLDTTALEGIEVTLLHDHHGDGNLWSSVATTTSASDGDYGFSNLPRGTYRLRFADGDGLYATHYYESAATEGEATDVILPTNASIAEDLDVSLQIGGNIAGTVSTSEGTGLEQVSLIAYRYNGSQWETIASATTNADGAYTISGLASGDYKVYVEPPTESNYAFEYYDGADGAATLEQAAIVSVSSGSTQENIDAILDSLAPPVAQITVATGTVTSDPRTGKVTMMIPIGDEADMTLTMPLSCNSGVPSDVTLQAGDSSYPMSESSPGNYQATIPAAELTQSALAASWNCSSNNRSALASSSSLASFDLGRIKLYNPSGYITDATTGEAIAGATVTLYNVPGWRPQNRPGDHAPNTCQSNNSKPLGTQWNQPAPTDLGVVVNPDLGQIDPAIKQQETNINGYYGWDAARGCWYIVVEAPGYETLISPVVGVPPEVTDLNMQLTPTSGRSGISLEVGWNLISVPVQPTDTDITQVLASIAGSYDLVYAYDACDTADSWKKYDPSAPPFANDLTDVDETMGLWIHMTAPATLSVSGTTPSTTDIPLCEGWNLTGNPSSQQLPVADALTSIDGAYDLIYAYQAADTADQWKKYDPSAPPFANDLTEMGAGWGYWIDANQDATWTVSNP